MPLSTGGRIRAAHPGGFRPGCRHLDRQPSRRCAMTTTMPALADYRPLRGVIPDEADLEDWTWMWSAMASDTAELVHHYQHQRTGRWLRLDRRCRVYAHDPHGQVRLF